MGRSIKIAHVLSIALCAMAAVMIAACQARMVAPVNATVDGIAIKGYDPVAYFLEKMPVPGSAEFTHAWQGAVWRFSSTLNRDAFRKDPERYAPRYGGYCAFAVSIGRTADIDPEAWTIVDGKLYLNLDRKTQKLWEQDIPGNIRKADKNWPRMLERGK